MERDESTFQEDFAILSNFSQAETVAESVVMDYAILYRYNRYVATVLTVKLNVEDSPVQNHRLYTQ